MFCKKMNDAQVGLVTEEELNTVEIPKYEKAEVDNATLVTDPEVLV